MRARPVLVAALVVCALLAGCTTPLSDGGGVQNGTDAAGSEPAGETDGDDALTAEERQRLRNDDLPTDEVAVYRNVTALLDSDAAAPTVTARDLTEQFRSAYGHTEDPRFRRLNLTEVRVDRAGTGGFAYADEVIVHRGGGDEAAVESVLVHEFTHTIQYSEEMIAVSEPRIPGWAGTGTDLNTTDADLAATALIEGGAMYVEDEYARRHLDGVDRPSARMDVAYREEPPGMRYVFAPYAFGADYANATLEDPSNLGALYREDPPVTTHGIMYPEAGVDEPADVTVETDVRAEGVAVARTDRMGAMFLHVALGAHLPEDAADEAARAWREDRLVEFEAGDERPFVWTLRLSDAEAADRVAALFERSLAERTDARADEFAVDRVGERTVAVVSGDREFRDRVAVSVRDGAVEIEVADDPRADAPAADLTTHGPVAPA